MLSFKQFLDEQKMLGKVDVKPYKYKHIHDWQTKDGKVRVKDTKKRNWTDEEEQDHLAYERGEEDHTGGRDYHSARNRT